MSKVLDEKRFGDDGEFLMSISKSDDGKEWDIILDDYNNELTSALYTDESMAQEAWNWGCNLIDAIFIEEWNESS